MFRNREFSILFICMLSISLIATAVITTISLIAGGITAMTCIILMIVVSISTKQRYNKLEELSNYLRKISNGNYTLDIRDNREGELSILKNDLFKMTKMLSENQSSLQEDKKQLMDAISDISHQLKTPLTSMTVMADLLEQDDLPQDKRTEFVHNIQTQLDRIEWLVSSLLKISKIDAGAVQFKQDVVHIDRLITQTLEKFAIPLDVKQINLVMNGDEGSAFIGDFNWTQEALINIVKNCIEHSEEHGTLSIDYRVNALFTEIIITDTGKGIPPEDLPYIFTRFYRGKHANEDSVGIGLAIAHTIISKQNGIIDVTSSENGTEFHIKFYKQVI